MTKSAEKKRILKEDPTSFASAGEQRVTDWRSIYVASAISFVGSVQFSLYFSSLWPYLQIVDRSTTETFFGYIVAIYSLGQIFSAPTFGYWSNQIKQVRLPLYVGLTLMFIGNLCYIMMEISSVPKRFILLVGRCITGMGSGNVILLRTYASTASTVRDRPKAIAYVTCGQALGNTVGPAFQLFFTPLSYPGIKLFGGLSMNMYTAPAYLACFMNIFGAIALYFLFKENYAGIIDDHEEEKKALKEAEDDDVEEGHHKAAALPMYDVVAVLVCYVTRFTQMFINTNLETIGSPFAMMMFSWTEDTAVTFTAAAQGVVGALTFAVYIAYIVFKIDKILNYRVSCMISLAALALFHIVTYAWPFLPGKVQTYTEFDLFLYIFNSTEEPVGCNIDKHAWCADLAPVNVWLYYGFYIVCVGLGFPILNITLTTLFSKILGPRRQGTQQGILQIVLYSSYGPQMAWMVEIVVISTTIFLWCSFYNRLVPAQIISLEDQSVAAENTRKIRPGEKRNNG
ncbi:Protein Y53G8AR.7 a [Aphelenchoides avenae]|nr:Protein Y53G8AR.7 a [Aphelenchus avenae]